MVDGKVEGKSEGASLERSGTFSEISERGNGIETCLFQEKLGTTAVLREDGL